MHNGRGFLEQAAFACGLGFIAGASLALADNALAMGGSLTLPIYAGVLLAMTLYLRYGDVGSFATRFALAFIAFTVTTVIAYFAHRYIFVVGTAPQSLGQFIMRFAIVSGIGAILSVGVAGLSGGRRTRAAA